MFQLITFDGISGSGKSTNHQKLCDHLNITREYDNIFSVMRHWIDHACFGNWELRINLWPTMVQLAWILDWSKNDRDIFILSGYWQYIIEFFRVKKRYDDSRDKIMDSIDNLLYLDSKPYPVCSFYMHTSHYQSKLRFFHREAHYGLSENKFENISVSGIEDTDEGRRTDERLLEITNWLSDRYPFFHIIDASRSEDEVFSDVRTIVDKELR